MRSMSTVRTLATAAVATIVLAAGGSAALADDVYNTLDTTVDAAVETTSVAAGSTKPVSYSVQPRQGDGDSGCNLEGTNQKLVVDVLSSAPAYATVSPNRLEFTSCGAGPSVTVTGVAAGTSTISLRQVSNSAVGTFNLTTATFTVAVSGPAKTATTTVVDCPEFAVFTGVPRTCTISTTGADGFTAVPEVIEYSPNVNVGPVSVSASYAGDATHLPSSGSDTFEITKASSVVSVDCHDAAPVYDGTAKTPCTATVTGAGSLNTALIPTYSANIDAGQVTATATYAGDANHTGDSDSDSFTIAKADSTTTITCDADAVVFDGSSHALCTATVTGDGGLNESVPVTYDDNVGAGNVTASATYGGSDNHQASSATAAFEIGKAAATCSVTGYDDVYDGAAHGLTGTCEGVGGVDLSTRLSLGGTFTDAGTHTVTWTFDGGRNYADQSSTATVDIERATPFCAVMGYSGPYTATPHGASGECTGVEDEVLDGLVVTGTATDVPGGSADWSIEESTNYLAASGSTLITITKVAANCAIEGSSDVYDATAHGATGSCSGIGNEDAGILELGASFTNVPGGTAEWTFTGNGNYLDQEGRVEIELTQAQAGCTITGYDKPYDAQAHGATGSCLDLAGKELPGLDLGARYTDVPGGAADWSLTGNTNYADQSGTVAVSISRAQTIITLVCDGAKVYTGTAVEPCSATVSGPGIPAGTSAALTYEDNTMAGAASVKSTWPEGANHKASAAEATFQIAKATPSCAIVGFSGGYDAATHGATGDCTGVDGSVLPDLDRGEAFSDVPGGTAVWTLPESANHVAASGSVAITLDPVAATCSVEGYTGTYDGAAHGATGACTGIGKEYAGDLDLGASYTDAPGGDATWVFEGNGNYLDDGGVVSVVIGQADAECSISGYDGVYDTADHGASGECLDLEGEELPGLDLGERYTDVPGGRAAWTLTGNTNYADESGEVDVVITKADTSITLTCPGGQVYTGAALTPCSASVAGAGIPAGTAATITYTGNTDAGQAEVSASWPGDANHKGSTATTSFTIAKAPSTVTVLCTNPVTYTGAALVPCSAKVTGAGGLDQALTVAYEANTNAGTATASASWDGDANHHPSSGSTTFTIAKAPTTTTVTCPAGPFYFTGSPITPSCSARVVGAGGLDTAVTPVTFSGNTAVGVATASATYGESANHLGSTGSTTFTIAAWRTSGFYQPVDMGGVWNSVKNGSTVPLKFELFAGPTELTTTSAVKSFTATQINCTSTTEDAVEEFMTTGGTALRYDSTGGQFVQNWQTPKKPGTCHRVTMTALDGSTISANFKLK